MEFYEMNERTSLMMYANVLRESLPIIHNSKPFVTYSWDSVGVRYNIEGKVYTIYYTLKELRESGNIVDTVTEQMISKIKK